MKVEVLGTLGTNTGPAYLKGACLSWAGSSVFYNFLLFLPCLKKKKTTDDYRSALHESPFPFFATFSS